MVAWSWNILAPWISEGNNDDEEAASACHGTLAFLCVLTQQLHRLTLIRAAVLQSGHVVDGVLDDQFQVRQFILAWEKQKTATNQIVHVPVTAFVGTRSPAQLSAGTWAPPCLTLAGEFQMRPADRS